MKPLALRENGVTRRNVGADNESFIVGQGLDRYADVSANLEQADPLYKDVSGGDFTLRRDSPAFALPGFEDIPFASMGMAR